MDRHYMTSLCRARWGCDEGVGLVQLVSSLHTGVSASNLVSRTYLIAKFLKGAINATIEITDMEIKAEQTNITHGRLFNQSILEWHLLHNVKQVPVQPPPAQIKEQRNPCTYYTFIT